MVLKSSCLYDEGKQAAKHKIKHKTNKSISFLLLRRFFQFAESVRLLELLNFLATCWSFCDVPWFKTLLKFKFS